MEVVEREQHARAGRVGERGGDRLEQAQPRARLLHAAGAAPSSGARPGSADASGPSASPNGWYGATASSGDRP